jgi:hypothetical protein
MGKKDTITVYWAPAPFLPKEDSWAMLYSEPQSVLQDLYVSNTPKGIMTRCPAVKDTLKNVFSFNSAIDDKFQLPTQTLESIAFTETANEYIPTDSKISVQKIRKSSRDNYINIFYNMGWYLFSSEPLKARFTAPYFPSASPVKGAFLASGEYDIGRWFRPFNLDYHIPLDSKYFSVKNEEPLFFVEFFTDKKIEFKKFNVSTELRSIAFESSNSPTRYGKNKSLIERYKMAHSAKIPQMVLGQIRKNLID